MNDRPGQMTEPSREDNDTLAAAHPALPEMAAALRAGRLGRRDFLRAATLLGLSAGTAATLAGLPLSGPARAAATAKRGGELRVSMNVKDISDPAIYDWTEKANVAMQVIEPLCRIGADNIVRPHLAARWAASEDLKTWTFHLRRGVTWSNGDEFGADDVVFNITRWLDPATGSSNIGRFASMTETVDGATRMRPGAVEKVDDHTVRFHLRVADLALPESFADYPALLVHRRFAEEGGNLVKNPVGTGPFRLKEFAVGERAVLVRREGYWQGDAAVDAVRFIDHGDDPSAWIAALASDQVDLLFRMFVEQVPIVRTLPHLALYHAVTAQTGVARMKVTKPPFDNPVLRRALRACIDHARILELAHQGLGEPGEDHHVSPVHPEYAALLRPKQDYALARRLLAEAGYPDGIDLAIDCVTQPTWETNACQAIAEMVKPAGIRLAVNVLPGGTYWDRWLDAPFGFTAWAHRPLGVQVLSLGYRSGVPWNETSYANPAFDALLDKALGLIDIDARRTVMAQLEAMLQADSVIILPFWRSVFTAANRRVQDFAKHPAEELHLAKVWLA